MNGIDKVVTGIYVVPPHYAPPSFPDSRNEQFFDTDCGLQKFKSRRLQCNFVC